MPVRFYREERQLLDSHKVKDARDLIFNQSDKKIMNLTNQLIFIYIMSMKIQWNARRLSADKYQLSSMESLNFQLKSRSPQVKLKMWNLSSMRDEGEKNVGDFHEYLSDLNIFPAICFSFWFVEAVISWEGRSQTTSTNPSTGLTSSRKLAAQWKSSPCFTENFPFLMLSTFSSLNSMHNSRNSNKIP